MRWKKRKRGTGKQIGMPFPIAERRKLPKVAYGGKLKPRFRVSQSSIEHLKQRSARYGTTAKLVYMSPDEYLSKVPSTADELTPASKQEDKHFCTGSVKFITEQIRKGEEMSVPYLDYSDVFRGWPSHEGRHRAFVAKKLGIKRIPVMVITK